MSSIVVSGDTSGAVTLAVPAVAGTNTVTIAAQTGTLNAAGPAFSAYASSTTSIANNAFTKVAFQTEEFDTNNNFDSTTNYRFTPTVAGYYQINFQVQFNSAPVYVWASIYKNGSQFKNSGAQGGNGAYSYGVGLSALIYLNGSTDYVEGYAYQNSGSSQNLVTGLPTYFQGFLVRGA